MNCFCFSLFEHENWETVYDVHVQDGDLSIILCTTYVRWRPSRPHACWVLPDHNEQSENCGLTRLILPRPVKCVFCDSLCFGRCQLVHVCVSACVCVCLTIKSREGSHWTWNSPDFSPESQTAGVEFLLHSAAFVQTLVNFGGMHIFSFLQFAVRLLQQWELSLPVPRFDFLGL